MPNVGVAKFQCRASVEPGLTSAMHSTSFGGFSTGDCGFGMGYPLAQGSNLSTIMSSCDQICRRRTVRTDGGAIIQIGSAPCRERGCQYVYISVVDIPLQNINHIILIIIIYLY